MSTIVRAPIRLFRRVFFRPFALPADVRALLAAPSAPAVGNWELEGGGNWELEGGGTWELES